MELPKSTKVYIHGWIETLPTYPLKLEVVHEGKDLWHIKEKGRDRSRRRRWWLLCIQGCCPTPEREEFFMNLAHAIDWEQYLDREDRTQII